MIIGYVHVHTTWTHALWRNKQQRTSGPASKPVLAREGTFSAPASSFHRAGLVAYIGLQKHDVKIPRRDPDFDGGPTAGVVFFDFRWVPRGAHFFREIVGTFHIAQIGATLGQDR